MGSKEEKEGVNVGGKKQTSWHDSIPRPKGKEEKQKCLQERRMNDEQSSRVCEAEATICLPAEVRTTRRHCRRGEELPPPSSCGPVSSLEPKARNEQLETYCRADMGIM